MKMNSANDIAHDEALIMAQSKSIYKARENKEQNVKATKKLNSNPTN